MIMKEFIFNASTDKSALNDMVTIVNSLNNCEILYTEHNSERYYNHQIDATAFGFPPFEKDDPLFELKLERLIDSIEIVIKENNRLAFVDIIEV